MLFRSDGSKDLSQRAREKALYIFENQKTDPVAPEIAAKLRSIVEAAEAEDGGI